MADKDYNFTICSNTPIPVGPVVKENMDVTRLTYDFTQWLDMAEDEIVEQVEFPTIGVLPYGSTPATNWRQDYPVDSTTTPDNTPPPDTYPLMVVDEAANIINNGLGVEIKVIAGTPAFGYVLSFLTVASVTRRRKQVDTIINIEVPSNPAMLGPGDINPDNITPPLIITGSTALPMGFSGMVFINNEANTPSIVITLPPNPVAGQQVKAFDASGTNGTYPVTFRADADQPMDVDGSIWFVSTIDCDVLEWTWTGSNWHLQTARIAFLG